MEAPAQLTNVAASHRGLILESMLRETHGALIDEVDELQQAIEAAQSAVEGGREKARLDLEIFDPAVFDEMAAPVEAKESVPWLRRGRVVDLDRGVERTPTSEEIATGIEAATLDEFNRRRAA